MTVTRGKRHTYLGMNINFNDDGNISIEMKDYLKKSIDAFGEQIKGTTPTPAKTDLFDTNDKTKQLCDEKSKRFHHIVSKLLYVAKRARPDIDSSVIFVHQSL